MIWSSFARCLVSGMWVKFSTHLTGKLMPVVWRDSCSLPSKLLWTLKTPWYAFTQNLAQYLGARSVEKKAAGRWEWWDRKMRKGV